MLEDKKLFSRTAQNVHIGSIMKDFISHVRKIKIKYKPDTWDIAKNNMPSRRNHNSDLYHRLYLQM